MTFDWEKNDAKEKFKNFKRKRSLSWAVVEVTEYCNFNCKWCFANAGENQTPIHMEKKNAFRLIETLADAGVKQITFSGGEPTVYPHIGDVISTAHDSGMVVHMNTNGYLLTRRFAEKLKEKGLSQVQINIDSLDPKSHDYIRGREGSHGRAIQALKNAKAAGLTCVSQTVLTKKNEDEIVDIFKFARSMGLQRCRVWDMTPSDGCAKENMELMPTDYISTLQELTRYASDTGAHGIETGDPLYPLDYETDFTISGGYCVAAAGLYCTISVDGNVYFCATLRESLYNVFEEINKGSSINDIHKLNVEEYTGCFEYSNCRSCNSFEICKGGCFTRRKAFPLGEDYWCNRHMQIQPTPVKMEETA